MDTKDEQCPQCDSKDKIGREVSEVYDGIVFRECKECGKRWIRDGKEQYLEKVEHHLTPPAK